MARAAKPEVPEIAGPGTPTAENPFADQLEGDAAEEARTGVNPLTADPKWINPISGDTAGLLEDAAAELKLAYRRRANRTGATVDDRAISVRMDEFLDALLAELG